MTSVWLFITATMLLLALSIDASPSPSNTTKMNAMYKMDTVVSRRMTTGGVVDAHGDNINISRDLKTTVVLMQDVLAAKGKARDTKVERTDGLFKFNV